MLCNSDKSSNMSVEYREQSAQKLWRMAPALHCTALDKEEGKKDDRWSQVSKHHLNFKKERSHTLSKGRVSSKTWGNFQEEYKNLRGRAFLFVLIVLNKFRTKSS
jgi:hypothetical protein